MSNTMRDFRLINSALAQGPLNDYKALICVFLSGGNDANNLLLPVSTEEYANYAAIRQNLALPLDDVNGVPLVNRLTLAGESEARYGFHPKATNLKTLFDEGKCAAVCNVGPLLYPMTRAQYQSGSVPKPPQLFSHSDQVMHWQTSLPDQPPKSGWGGRVADLLHPYQNELLSDPVQRAQIALCSSIAGANTFEVGNVVQQYHVSTSGAVTLAGLDTNRLQAVKDLLSIDTVNLQRMALADVSERAAALGTTLNSAIAPTSSSTYWTVPFSTGSLGTQLRMVARLIAARNTLKMKRQIFFVSVGSYDTHTNQLSATDATAGTQANLLGDLSNGLFAFQRAMEQLAKLTGPDADSTLASKVTAFTASDFGRTLPANGDGSDHGWGSHHLVVGGAVRGKQLYGRFPVLKVNGPDDTSTGRFIPSTSVDEYSATLASWFGVSPTYLSTVFPNLGRFANPNLGFML